MYKRVEVTFQSENLSDDNGLLLGPKNKNAADFIAAYDVKAKGGCKTAELGTDYENTSIEDRQNSDDLTEETLLPTMKNGTLIKQKMPDDKFTCDHCTMSFRCVRGIKKHIENHFHAFCCQLCKASYPRGNKLIEHMRKDHLKNTSYDCTVCSKRDLSEMKIIKHMMEAHKMKTKRCSTCDKIIPQSEYRKHVLFHTAEKNTCPVCQKRFRNRNELYRHEGVHKQEYNFQCEICMKKYRSYHRLYSHKLKSHRPRIIKKEMEFTCHICGKVFSSNISLQQHLKIHNDKRFLCDQCDKKFTFKHQMLNHIKSHSDVRTYECDTCGSKFKMPHHLRNHILTHKL